MAVDRDALEALVPRLRRYARGLAGGRQAADDLVQDALVLALSRERQFRGGSLSGWVFAILTNVARSRFRSEMRAPASVDYAELADAGADMAARIGILAGLAALPAEQREPLLLTAIEGFTYAETAGILSVPVGTVMSRIARARDALAERLGGSPVVPIRRVK